VRVSRAHVLNRGDDIRVRAAPAQIPAHALADVIITSSTWLPQERQRGHDLPGGAIAALKAVVIEEGLLHRMQLVAFGQTFDGGNVLSLRGDGQGETGQHAPPIDVDSARAALAVIATFLRTGEVQMLTQRVEQRRAWIEG